MISKDKNDTINPSHLEFSKNQIMPIKNVLSKKNKQEI